MNDNNNNVEQDNYYGNDSYYSNDNYSNNNYSDSSYEEKDNKGGLWWKILLIILILLIIILLLLKFCTGGSKNSKDVAYEELRVKVCAAAEKYVASNTSIINNQEVGKSATIKFQTLADANLIEARIANPYYDGTLFKKGTQEKYYSMNNSVRLTVQVDGTYFCELVDNSSDVTAPELRLNGDSEITLAVGTEFEDPGYTATDDYDGDVTDKVVRSGNVDHSKAGTYTITYTVQDAAGNVTSKKRTVIYEEFGNLDITLGSVLDGVTPMISLKGANPYCMVKDTEYVEPGATATDNVDGNITDRITVTNKVSGKLMGAFRVVYKVEDSSGNQAIAYRAVIVTTSCPENGNNNETSGVNNRPTITLIGKSAVTINKGTEYIDLGATAYDKEDGDLTYKLVTDATQVNVNKPGVYKVIYRVTDSSNLTATKTRTVTVKDPNASNPSVRFTEDKKNITVAAGEGKDSLLSNPKAVNENGVEVTVTRRIEDYYNKNTVSSIDWSKPGKYRVIYTATHQNGQISQTKSIVVTIIEPTVEIGGKNPIEIPLRRDNCDITEADLIKGGVTFKVTGDKTPIVLLKGNENKACKTGTYEIEVSATIDNGEPTTKKITVKVVDKEDEERPVSAPGKVTITKNSANASDPYNMEGKWVGGATTGITVEFSAVPATGTEIARFEYSEGCSNVDGYASVSSSNTGSFTWTLEGKHNVCVRAVNKDNVAGPWSDITKLYLDRSAPSVVFTHKWADGKDDWHNSPTLTVEYSAAEQGSGLDHFEYTYDDVKAKKAEEITTYSEATGKLVVSENTEASRPSLFVYVRAVDKVGNVGEWTVKPAYTNIDTVKPFAPTLAVSGNNTALVKINATFKDGESIRPSGFGKFIYTLNDGAELTETSTVISMPGHSTAGDITYNVKVWAVDKAGNRSDNFTSESVNEKQGIPATGITIKNGNNDVTGKSCSTVTLYPSAIISLDGIVAPDNATNKTVTWKSSNTNVASIDINGNVKAIKAGTTTITANVGGISASCTLDVTATSAPSSSDSGGGVYIPSDKTGDDKPQEQEQAGTPQPNTSEPISYRVTYKGTSGNYINKYFLNLEDAKAFATQANVSNKEAATIAVRNSYTEDYVDYSVITTDGSASTAIVKEEYKQASGALNGSTETTTYIGNKVTTTNNYEDGSSRQIVETKVSNSQGQVYTAQQEVSHTTTTQNRNGTTTTRTATVTYNAKTGVPTLNVTNSTSKSR
jgi:hypothetical protein